MAVRINSEMAKHQSAVRMLRCNINVGFSGNMSQCCGLDNKK
jgi:hypothetical protein